MGNEKKVIDLESFANDLSGDTDLSKELEDTIREADQSQKVKVTIKKSDEAKDEATQGEKNEQDQGAKSLSDHLADTIADLDEPGEAQPESLPEPKPAEEEPPKDDYYDRLLRVTADFENYKKRMIRERADNLRYANERFATEVLPCLDNFERALKASEQTDVKSLLEGVKMIYDQLQGVMKRNGVEGFDPSGEPFDPSKHQAMDMRPTAEMEPNHILEVYQKGYLLNDRLIRPAMVVVSAAPIEDQPTEGQNSANSGNMNESDDEGVDIEFSEPENDKETETKDEMND